MAPGLPILTLVLTPGEQRRLAASLPSGSATRWTNVRKAQVVKAVASGVLSLEEAQRRYALSLEEFMSWQDMVAPSRMRSLRAAQSDELSASARG